MKLPGDLVKMYKEIHSWVGIVTGLFLFIAFYAGAITMFEEPLQRWASPASHLAPAPSLERTPELVRAVTERYPAALRSHRIHLQVDSANPGRVSWTEASEEEAEHGRSVTTYYASLRDDGSLQVQTRGPSPVAQFIDLLHQQVGLAFLTHEWAMPIMGAVAVMYMIAIVSGLVVLLPSLVSDLFAVRIGPNLKRMWLDVHNVLGLFSIPFHVIMALTAIVFAFHDQFYGAQGLAFGGTDGQRPAAIAARPAQSPPPALPPAQIVARVREQAPGFEPIRMEYSRRPNGAVGLRVAGVDPRYGLRGATFGIAQVDAATGRITGSDYLPGHQDGWSATITSFFALHFGNFGGNGIRWAYFLLGLAGAFLFHTGNLIWIETRRRRERKTGTFEQTRATCILGALTVGVSLGCIAGISLTIAAAKLLGDAATSTLHAWIYYVTFLAFTGYALLRGAARSGFELTLAGAASMLAIPLASLSAGRGWYDTSGLLTVDAVAVLLAVLLFIAAQRARRRAAEGPQDSVWANASASGARNRAPTRAEEAHRPLPR